MLHCLTASQANLCGDFSKMYYVCKRERDAQIYQSIKEWELEHFHSPEFTQRNETGQRPEQTQKQEEYLTEL